MNETAAFSRHLYEVLLERISGRYTNACAQAVGGSSLRRLLPVVLALAPTFAAGACGREVVPPLPTLEALNVERVKTYGRLGPPDDVEGHKDPKTGTLGILSNIRDATVAQNGNLFVLDRELRQVVVFHPSGEVLRAIGGGYGEGPGEFSFPTTLTLERGTVFVLDVGLTRVSWFDTTGVFLNSINVDLPGEARSIAVTNDTLWVLSRITTSNNENVVHGYSLAGQPLFARGDPTPRTVAFADHGSPGSLAELKNGDVLYVSGVPIQWSSARRDDWVAGQVGRYLWPGREPMEWRDENGRLFRRTPGGTRGLMEFESGSIGVLYYEVRGDGPASKTTYVDYLALFSASGEWVARYAFPDSLGPLSFIRFGGSGQSFLTASHTPFPRVLRYTLDDH